MVWSTSATHRRISLRQRGTGQDGLERHWIASERGFHLSFLFRSNSSFSDEGIHRLVIIFAIERGDEYTLDADCKFPITSVGHLSTTPSPRVATPSW